MTADGERGRRLARGAPIVRLARFATASVASLRNVATPFGPRGERVRERWGRRFARVALAVRPAAFALGGAIFFLVVVAPYDRAVSLAGRSEVLAVRADGTDFAAWDFPGAGAEFWPGPDVPVQQGAVSIRLDAGAEARFVRLGRGPLSVAFAAHRPLAAPPSTCPPGAARVGTVRPGGDVERPLCDDARLTLAPKPGDPPLVISLRGAVEVGEEVRAGAGAQPVLLGGAATLFVRHGGGAFRAICSLEPLQSICDRFVAVRSDLTAGDSLSLRAGHADAVTIGFARLDPDEAAGGLQFDIAAPRAALEVRRLKGETFEISESLFDRVQHSPLIQALNAVLLVLGLIWYFERLPGRVREGHEPGGNGTVVIFAVLLAATPARADQVLLRAGETGQALLRSRADRCYAVTPRHVLGDETAASVVAPGRRLGDADLLRRIPAAPEDVALLSVRALPADLCPPFEGVQPLDGLLRGRAGAVLRLVRQDGSIDRLPLLVLSVDVETFEVRPEGAAELSQGMSGGTVLLADQPAGLLVDVTEGGRLGRVARLDRVFERLTPYLAAGLSLPRPGSAPPAAPDWIAAEVVRWTAEPVSPAHRADSLLSPGGEPWRVAASTADVILRLAPGAVLAGIEVNAGKLPDPPRALEVFAGSSERGPWRSLTVFALEASDGVQTRSIPPIRAAFVLLRATGVQAGEKATLALTGVRLLSPR